MLRSALLEPKARGKDIDVEHERVVVKCLKLVSKIINSCAVVCTTVANHKASCVQVMHGWHRLGSILASKGVMIEIKAFKKPYQTKLWSEKGWATPFSLSCKSQVIDLPKGITQTVVIVCSNVRMTTVYVASMSDIDECRQLSHSTPFID